ncbi:DEAD/DEAH box helicase family protein [Amycolatopsis japonica]|uniref:DEAD/DEAH box helicase n=1 Tax=Amycolatopsis japonica TaxID=208439 RepID=UPI00332728C7
MAIATSRVWARPLVIEGNAVRQLLVEKDLLEVVEEAGDLRVVGKFGVRPATRLGHSADDGPLTAVVPAVHGTHSRVQWNGSNALAAPAEVLRSCVGAIGFREPGEQGSLRRPQVGALHSVIGYWSSGLTEPGIVVMPTGTGKTETMLALFVATRPGRLLVIVPTSALRDQIADKFITLGILQREEIVAPTALRPCVAKLEHGIEDPAAAAQLAAATNVVVATPQVLGKFSIDAREAFLAAFSDLIVDEAHHAPAPSWTSIIDAFAGQRVLLFTATPFREDGKSLPGKMIYRFPLREAQKDGYFTPIDYKTVVSLEDTDAVLAEVAITRLRADLERGYDHVIMARAASVTRAKSILKIYQAKAPDLAPALIYDKLAKSKRDAVITALKTSECRVVVCVDMLGEGFDLPTLKIAALHDAKKSLSPMIQFIGRFTRAASATNARIGTAAAFVRNDPGTALSPLRDLLREDADWNLLLRDITERATAAAEEITAFDTSFSGGPDDVSTPSLEPKMSAIAHRAPISAWDPERALDFYGPDQVLDGRIAIGVDGTLAWFVVEHRGEVPWGDIQTLDECTYELIVMYFAQRKRLLYIHSSDNNGDYADLAEAVLGEGATAITGPVVFRVLANLDRLTPSNIGLLDARDHFNRYTMYVGSDVLEALAEHDKQGKTQTHIATSGFNRGEKVTISAALSGRFWSMTTAPNLRAWKQWCDTQGEKLLNDDIDLVKLFNGLIVPKEVQERPEHVLLAAEWAWEFFAGNGTTLTIAVGEKAYLVTDVEFVVDDHGTTGPFELTLTTPAWKISYQAKFTSHGLHYAPLGDDALVSNRRTTVPLQSWINKNKPNLFLAGDRLLLPDDRLLEPQLDLAPFPTDRMVTPDWKDVDLKVESQGKDRRVDSIQAYMSKLLRTSTTFDVMVDDDRANEAADLVGLRIAGDELHVVLVHCKFSSESEVGARLKDLYEVCGQAVRGAKWRQQGALPLLRHLERRAKAYHSRTGVSPFETGDMTQLHKIMGLGPQLRPRFQTIIAQPGFSRRQATAEHLRVIAGAESYVRAVTGGSFDFYCQE